MSKVQNATIDLSRPSNGRGATTGMVRLLLRTEGLAALSVSLIAFHSLDGSWWIFAALFFVPDVFMVGYFVDSRVGAALYNTGHTYVMPAMLALSGYIYHQQEVLQIALVWSAHIGFDRLFGYGLKYPENFKSTHLMSDRS